MRHHRRYLFFIACLLLAINLRGCGAPELYWPKVEIHSENPQPLKVGASACKITPAGPIFTAGAFPFRIAFNIHDDLWARVVVFDEGTLRVALVSLDLIGINYEDVVRIRAEVHEKVKVDYVLVACTHTHTAPDLVGMWSPMMFQIDDFYRKYLRMQVVRAVREACDNLRPATLRIASAPAGEPALLRDTREPIFINDTLTIWQAVDDETHQILATAVHFASHPILVPSSQFDISSDFVHYLRQAMESGMEGDDGPVYPQGGVCLYFNADMAGRLIPTNTESLTAGPPVEHEYRRAQAYGYRLAHRAQKILSENREDFTGPMEISIVTEPLRLTVENLFLQKSAAMNLINRAMIDDQIQTEVGIVRVGPMEFFAIPGMIFPELVLGNFSAVPGSDFPDAEPESPALSQMARQPYFIPVGLANDMLGYIIPECLWDAEPPWVSSENVGQYGEIVCPGPQTARKIIEAFSRIQNR